MSMEKLHQNLEAISEMSDEEKFEFLKAGLEQIRADTETAGSDYGMPQIAELSEDLLKVLESLEPELG